MEVRISSVPVMDALSQSWVVGVEAEPHWQGAYSPETVAAVGRLSDYTVDKADQVVMFPFYDSLFIVLF